VIYWFPASFFPNACSVRSQLQGSLKEDGDDLRIALDALAVDDF
jgi:hypothetical protein